VVLSLRVRTPLVEGPVNESVSAKQETTMKKFLKALLRALACAAA
jgi:hypothetical protein